MAPIRTDGDHHSGTDRRHGPDALRRRRSDEARAATRDDAGDERALDVPAPAPTREPWLSSVFRRLRRTFRTVGDRQS